MANRNIEEEIPMEYLESNDQERQPHTEQNDGNSIFSYNLI